MNECKFFYENGEEIAAKDGKAAKERFIEFYSGEYRKENEKHWDLEVEMEKLLDPDNNAPLTTEDIAHILCWKVNRNPGLPEEGEYRINSRSGAIIIRDELGEVPEFKRLNEQVRKFNKISEFDEGSAKDFVRNLVNFRYSASKSSGETGERTGIGFVYAVTLLFIATKGAYPIYDMYAHIGLDSIRSGGNPTDEQCKVTKSRYEKMFCSPSHEGAADITDAAIDKAWEEYMGYKHLLMGEDGKSKGIFEDVYDEHGFHYRDVDRALWKYGHLFYVS